MGVETESAAFAAAAAEADAAEADPAELRVAVPVDDLVHGDVGDLGTALPDHGVDGVQLLELQCVNHRALRRRGCAQKLSILTLSRYRKRLKMGAISVLERLPRLPRDVRFSNRTPYR